MTIGERIKAARKSAGYSQPVLADILSVSATAVSQWERDVFYPKLLTLLALCEVLGASPNTITGWKGKK